MCILGITPHYNIITGKVWTCIMCKIVTVLEILALVIVKAMCFLPGSEFSGNKGSRVIWILLEIFLDGMEIGSTVSILVGGAFGSMGHWKNILQFCTNRSYFKNIPLIFAVIILIPLITSVPGVYTWIAILGFETYKYNIVRDIQRYHALIAFLYNMLCLVMVKRGFKRFNDRLIQVINEVKTTDRILKQKKLKGTKIKLRTLFDIQRQYRSFGKLCEIVKGLNHSSGWHNLFNTGHSAALILRSLYLLVNLMESKANENSKTTDSTALLAISAALAFGIVVSI